MATLKQIEANRLNSQKSTGPRSVEGKSAVRMNALKSGIDAKSTIIRGENPADLEALTNEYLAAYSPVTPQERFYVDILIRSDWQMRRLTRADAQIWEYQYDSFSHMPADCPLGKIYVCTDRTFARLQRRMKDVERSYKDASQELARLQSCGADDRFMSSVESGPANQPAPPSHEPTPTSEPSPQPTATKPVYPRIGFVSPEPITIPSPPVPDAPGAPPQDPGEARTQLPK